ncbi:hypothetical protein [Natronomonas sp. EA1]|uniref:hypothetical protein n=1 Tax=Natronomonas sp. EA1 TaxID=3421655 RepID=UPI003EB6BCEE
MRVPRPSTRAALLVLVGVLVLAQPVVGNGPGPETAYVYESAELDFDDSEAVEALYRHPEVQYLIDQRDLVREAANETVERPADELTDAERALATRRFAADDHGDQYYRLRGSVENRTFRLDAERVSPRTVADALTVARLSDPVRDAARTGQAVSRSMLATGVVETADGPVLVYEAGTTQVRDPWLYVKLPAYALGAVCLVLGLLGGRTRISG